MQRLLPRFRSQQFYLFKICREILKFIEICMETHFGAHPDGHQHGGRKPTETSVTEFCYKSVNSFLKELKVIVIILFLIQELFR